MIAGRHVTVFHKGSMIYKVGIRKLLISIKNQIGTLKERTGMRHKTKAEDWTKLEFSE